MTKSSRWRSIRVGLLCTAAVLVAIGGGVLLITLLNSGDPTTAAISHCPAGSKYVVDYEPAVGVNDSHERSDTPNLATNTILIWQNGVQHRHYRVQIAGALDQSDVLLSLVWAGDGEGRLAWRRSFAAGTNQVDVPYSAGPQLQRITVIYACAGHVSTATKGTHRPAALPAAGRPNFIAQTPRQPCST